MEYKFTKELKDSWLTALKSGKYVQGKGCLHDKFHNTFCCIGVLGDIHPDLDVDKGEIKHDESPYEFLAQTISPSHTILLHTTNDKTFNPHKPDYSNVIPLIESLPTID